MVPTSILAATAQRRTRTALLNDKAYERIKEMIISLELPPASLLDESALAHELDMGLTPVRQALRRLAMENLVVILPRRGTLVADLNLSDLQKIFEMRIELEALAAQLACQRATPEQVAQMDRVLADVWPHVDQFDNQALMDVDHQLHGFIAQSAHNEFLAETLDRLYGHVRRLWNLSIDRVGGLPAAMAEHREILDAIQSGDADRAGQLMRDHVHHFQQEVIATL